VPYVSGVGAVEEDGEGEGEGADEGENSREDLLELALADEALMTRPKKRTYE